MSDTYSYSTNGEIYDGSYPSREAAIADGEVAAADEEKTKFWTGRCVAPTAPEDVWEAADWLEHVSVQDDYSHDTADDWYSLSTKEQRAELESLVRPIMAAWLDRHGLRPTHFVIDEVVEHEVK